MAKHETEMHRQNRTMRAALELIAKGDCAAGLYARQTLRECYGKPDFGLFRDERQMDLADRRDLR